MSHVYLALTKYFYGFSDVQKVVKNEEATDAEKEARKAAIRAKIRYCYRNFTLKWMQFTNVFFREALLSAAASGALNSAQDKVNNNNQTSIVQPPKHLNNNLTNTNNNAGKGQINKPQPQKVNNGVQRKPSTSSIPEKKRETIWDFFEQGNKKGTCRYVFIVGILHLSSCFPELVATLLVVRIIRAGWPGTCHWCTRGSTRCTPPRWSTTGPTGCWRRTSTWGCLPTFKRCIF